MQLASITQIIELKNSLKEKIAETNKTQFKDSLYGSESEYTYFGLLGGIDCLLTDITSLTKAPTQFLKISTYTERQAIITSLKNIDAYINSPDSLLQFLDSLKQAVRPFHVRYTKERLLDFDEELSNATRKKMILEEDIEKIKSTKTDNENLLNELTFSNKELETELDKFKLKLEETNNSNEELIVRLSILTEKIADGDKLILRASEIVDDSNDLLTEAKKSAKSIQDYELTIDERQVQANNIDDRTKEYVKNIENFEKERKSLNEKAQDTIDHALTALEYNTARGLSASFQAQLSKIEDSKFHFWLFGATFFLLLTISIGIWIVLSGHLEISATIGRLALTPLTITGAIFCANQYIRQKNVIEDYTYKMVLAKSIVGFSEQLNNGKTNSEEYKEYIKLALSEIHKDPLRKRSKTDKDVDGGIKSGIDLVVETAQKIAGLMNNK